MERGADRRRRWISSRREKEGRRGCWYALQEIGGRGGLYDRVYAYVDARDICASLSRIASTLVRRSVRPSVRPFIRSYVRTYVGSFVRFFVMTVDETMTYFSGFHSRRAPRLFHSRFLASSLCFSAVAARMHARTHAHSRCLGRNIVSYPALPPSTASFLPFFLRLPHALLYVSFSCQTVRHFPLVPYLVKPFNVHGFSPSFFQHSW